MFEIICDMIDILGLTVKLILMIYGGWKFLLGDKDNKETLWYGVLFIATMV